MKIVIKIPDDVYTRLFDNGIQDNEIAVDDICEMARAIRLGTPLEAQPCEDCISRQAVIILIDEASEMHPYKVVGDSDTYSNYNQGWSDACDWLYANIEGVPSVTPKYTDEEIDKAQAVEQAYVDKMVELAVEEAKRPKGKWMVYAKVEFGDFKGTEKYKCSECGHEVGVFLSRYCPNCGAEMGGADETN